jgi:hypothetical protein
VVVDRVARGDNVSSSYFALLFARIDFPEGDRKALLVPPLFDDTGIDAFASNDAVAVSAKTTLYIDQWHF